MTHVAPSIPRLTPARLRAPARTIPLGHSHGAPTPIRLLTRDRLLPPVLAGLVMWGIAAGRVVSEALSQGHSLGLAAVLLLPPLIYWLLLLPVVLWLGIRFPLRRHTLLRSLPVHVGAAALLAAGYAELMVRVMGRFIGDDPPAWAGSVADWPVRF